MRVTSGRRSEKSDRIIALAASITRRTCRAAAGLAPGAAPKTDVKMSANRSCIALSANALRAEEPCARS